MTKQRQYGRVNLSGNPHWIDKSAEWQTTTTEMIETLPDVLNQNSSPIGKGKILYELRERLDGMWSEFQDQFWSGQDGSMKTSYRWLHNYEWLAGFETRFGINSNPLTPEVLQAVIAHGVNFGAWEMRASKPFGLLTRAIKKTAPFPRTYNEQRFTKYLARVIKKYKKLKGSIRKKSIWAKRKRGSPANAKATQDRIVMEVQEYASILPEAERTRWREGLVDRLLADLPPSP